MLIATLIWALLVVPVSLASESEWGRFRGPDGAGIARDSGPYPDRLDPESNLLWQIEIGAGHSSPCIDGELLYLTAHEAGDDGDDGDELVTLAIDRYKGEVLWRRAVAVEALESHHDVHGPASPSPTAGGGRVHVAFGSVGLLTYDRDGNELWRRESALPKNRFGSAASPVLVGERLLVVRDEAESSTLECLAPANGKTLWRREREAGGAGWSTPIVRSTNAGAEVVTYGAGWLTAYALADGEERWMLPGLTDEPIITPVASAGRLYVTSYNMRTNPDVESLPTFDELLAELDADDSGDLDREEAEKNESVLSRVDADGEGDHPLRIFFRWLDEDGSERIDAEEWKRLPAWLDSFEFANGLLAVDVKDGSRPAIAWQDPRGTPECPSPLVYRGRVYLLKNGGFATCFDATSGELLYRERTGARGPAYASPVAADDKVYTVSARGVVTVLAATKEFEVLSQTDLGERALATPALADGCVYVRTASRVLAFGAR